MTEDEKRELHQRILESELDGTTKVHLFKILDGQPTKSELHLVNELLKQNRRHNFVDSPGTPLLNPL